MTTFPPLLHAVVALLAGLALTGCERSDAGSTGNAAAAPAPNVQVVKPKQGEIVRTLTLPGQVRAYQEATLYAKVAGYLKSIAVDRGDRVRAGDFIAEIEAPEMLADETKLKAELEVARIELQRVTEAQKKAPDLVMPQTVDAARGRFEVAKASLERIETLLGFARISAPFAGIITKRWADPGAFIPSATGSSAARNAAVVLLSDFSRVRVKVAVPEPEVAHVRQNLPVRVRADGLPGREFEGKITRFAYGLDEMTKTMATEIEIANPDLALRPGMMASVKLTIERKPDALLLPAETLISEKNKSYVFAYRDGKAERVPVKLGFDDGVSVEIVEGVQAGDAVILAGQQAVTDGQPVNATEAR
ncbi:MAG: efflux RND transporter periplasmic adaptor subunit [Verrucomicrobia bacterium]|nr:efflux RND transporter periplasmic adaptor subunit [Verrucomicrobiota bacterium]